MRKIAEIRRDLAAKVAEVKGIQNSPENADALKKGVAEVKALLLELEQAEAVEAAAQRETGFFMRSAQKKATGGNRQVSRARRQS